MKDLAPEEELAPRLAPYAGQFFENMIEYAKDIPHQEFFECLHCMNRETNSFIMFRDLWQNEPSYAKLAMSLVKTLVERIENELQKTPSNKLITHQRLRVISEVAKQRDFILENHKIFAETLAPLFKYLETGLLDEDALLESLNFLMEHTREVSTPIFNFAEIVLPIMFDKKKDELGVLFKFLNQLCSGQI